jgi:hypothetical protein
VASDEFLALVELEPFPLEMTAIHFEETGKQAFFPL